MRATDSVCIDCSLLTVNFMVPRFACIGEELNDLHRAGLVHQAVHLHFVLDCEGDWELADTLKAARMDSSLDKSL